jgi:hypothetical protein
MHKIFIGSDGEKALHLQLWPTASGRKKGYFFTGLTLVRTAKDENDSGTFLRLYCS